VKKKEKCEKDRKLRMGKKNMNGKEECERERKIIKNVKENEK
jgi:hypothetical protein